MNILITGAAGFIGHALVKALAANRHTTITGIDNLNDYYTPRLKEARLRDLGVMSHGPQPTASATLPNFSFMEADIADRETIDRIFSQGGFTHVCNLAGQAGVRFSIESPYSYVESNVLGFLNILEGCRHHHVGHLLFASSSSVYGMDDHVPFGETDDTSHPVSLYAATKKSDEVMAYAYTSLYGFQTTALRFFTVYGPWGRPDMAPFKFMDAIANDRPIKVFNHGDMLRDFTYIDDIVEGVVRVMRHAPERRKGEDGLPIPPYKLYNIGNNSPVNLLDFVTILQEELLRAGVLPQDYDFEKHKELVPMQPGDVPVTYADTTPLEQDFGFKPNTSLREGLRKFAEWYAKYYETYI